MCKRCFDIGTKSRKGFTLIELMIVVAIMGILSTMGVVGFHNAVRNSRAQDVARNTVAFLERTANESVRMSETLCLQKKTDQVLAVYKGDCADVEDGASPLFDFKIDPPMRFVDDCLSFDCDDEDGCSVNLIDGTHGVFKPKLGLTAAPSSGYVCAQYGSSTEDGVYGAALKRKTENTIRATFGIQDDGDDSEMEDL